MAADKEMEIAVDDLKLDLENPRGKGYADQVSALESIVKWSPSKLVALAEDIATQGMNPADRMIVIKDESDDRYIVLEGNRRLAAVKLLCDPTRISAMPMSAALGKRMRTLSDKLDHTLVDPQSCVILESREEADHWITLRHTGENEGAGVVPWDGEESARFRGKEPALQVLEFVRNNPKLDSKTREDLERFPITNLGRILGDPDCRNALGLSIENGKVSAFANEAALFKGLKRLVRDIGGRTITVTDIKRKADRAKYIKSIKDDLPDPRKQTGSWLLSQGPASAGAQKDKGKKSKPLASNRKRLIPRTCILEIDEPRINAIYHELQRRVDVQQAPNAVAVLSRLFLELSVDHYLATFKLKPGKDELKAKVEMVKEDLRTKGVPRDTLTPIGHALSVKGAPFSIDLLHMYVHNRSFNPIPSELNSSWDSVQGFFEALWTALQ
jgi:hypothetical protein